MASYPVTRSRRNVAWTGLGALIVVVVFALFPYIYGSGTLSLLVQAFIVLTLASMWNLLAGYGGLVSVGQQGFVGIGAYRSFACVWICCRRDAGIVSPGSNTSAWLLSTCSALAVTLALTV